MLNIKISTASLNEYLPSYKLRQKVRGKRIRNASFRGQQVRKIQKQDDVA